jgi:hypothetical protein
VPASSEIITLVDSATQTEPLSQTFGSNVSVDSLGSTSAFTLQASLEQAQVRSIGFIPTGVRKEMVIHHIGHSEAILIPFKQVLAVRKLLDDLPDPIWSTGPQPSRGLTALKIETDIPQATVVLQDLLRVWNEMHLAIARLRICAKLETLDDGQPRPVHCLDIHKSAGDIKGLEQLATAGQAALAHQADKIRITFRDKGLITPLVRWTSQYVFEVDASVAQSSSAQQPGPVPTDADAET